jgi:type II secretory pathway pseudopilin PulG
MELVVTVAIIGILAALAMPAYSSMVDIALAAACKYKQSQLEPLLSVYQAENKENYVTSDAGLQETVIMLNGASSTEVSHSLFPLTNNTGSFECPAAAYYKVGGSLSGHFVTDGFVVCCATDNYQGKRSDGKNFVLDLPRTWESKSWNHVRE